MSTSIIERIPHILPLATPAEKIELFKLLEQRTRAQVDNKAELENDLGAFTRAAWRVLNPGRPFLWSWHYDLIVEYLTLVRQRKIRRLILNVPPRSAKTTFATICFPLLGMGYGAEPRVPLC